MEQLELPSDHPVDAGKSRTRSFAVAMAALTVALAVSLAMLFVSSEATGRVADNAAHLHWTNSMVGSVGLARAANAQAVFFAVDEAIGVATEEATRAAVIEAEETLEPVRANLQVPTLDQALDTTVGEATASFVEAADRVLLLIASDDVVAAAEANKNEVEIAFVSLEQTLLRRQAFVEAQIADTETLAGRLSTATRFLVTLLIPMSALFLYRRIVKRQVREAGLVMEAKLKAEQELNRAKDEFIAGLSHEFRTPLTSIFGFSEVLIDSGLIDPDASMELISLINAESAELSRMVEDLLTAARLEAGALSISLHEVDPRETVESVLGPWKRAGRRFLVRIDDGGMMADPLRIRQVLRNLVSNAAKHGGTKMAVVGRSTLTGYELSVVDDGPGVSEEIEARLFERYIHDGSRALLAGSVGLGLNIARSLAEAMGGSLTYARRGDKTWFTVTVPTAEPNAMTAPSVELGAA